MVSGTIAIPKPAPNGLPPPSPAEYYQHYAAPIGPPLPPGWESVVDPQTGQQYFSNIITGQTLWERPV